MLRDCRLVRDGRFNGGRLELKVVQRYRGLVVASVYVKMRRRIVVLTVWLKDIEAAERMNVKLYL